MEQWETDYLEDLRQHTARARTFFSNKLKSERERSVCRAFLRTIGAEFDDSQLIAPAEEPVDVLFGDFRFQIQDMLDSGRKPDMEWKNKEQEYAQARSLRELLKPYSPPSPVTLKTLVPSVTGALVRKFHHYGKGCETLDMLVYINSERRYLARDSDIPNLTELKLQGWRSASLLFPPYGVVLFATPMAPAFLRSLAP